MDKFLRKCFEELRPALAGRSWTDIEWLTLEQTFLEGIRAVNATIDQFANVIPLAETIEMMNDAAEKRIREINEIIG